MTRLISLIVLLNFAIMGHAWSDVVSEDNYSINFPCKSYTIGETISTPIIGKIGKKGYQCYNDLAIFTFTKSIFDGEILSKESIDAFFKVSMEPFLKMLKNARLLEKKRIIFHGYQALESKVRFQHIEDGQIFNLCRIGIIILDGNKVYELSIQYRAEDENAIKDTKELFIGSLIIKK